MSSKAISGEIDNEISSRSVRRRLEEANLPGRIARNVPLLRGKHFSDEGTVCQKSFSLVWATWVFKME